jgi:hypothetical protein
MDPTSSNSSSPSSPKLTNQSAPKAQSLEDIFHKFGSVKDISYTLFKIEAYRLVEALLPANFLASLHLYNYFTLFLLVELIITCRALGLMRLAPSALSWSVSSARTHELNRITFTYYATSIPRYDLCVVLCVPGEPTLSYPLSLSDYYYEYKSIC